MKRGERIIKKVIDYYALSENITKPLRQVCDELGLDYNKVKIHISRYGKDRFYAELARAHEEFRKEHIVPERIEAERKLWRWACEKAEDPNTPPIIKVRLLELIEKVNQRIEGIKQKFEGDMTVRIVKEIVDGGSSV